ncbi:MAG TPA: hypothetical protein VFE20_00345 [Thermoleophilia bacterium]|nr:hypothetical protein [Thermoleophilia bacterium]
MDARGHTDFDLLVNIQSYGDEELKQLSESLEKDEREISKRRRLIHGQLDILRAEMVRRLRDKHRSGESLFGEGDVDRLSSILSSPRRDPVEGSSE